MLEHWQLEMTEKKLVAMIEKLEDRIKVLEKELKEVKINNVTVVLNSEKQPNPDILKHIKPKMGKEQ